MDARYYHMALALTWVVVAGFALVPGLEYYVLPMQERAYSEMHSTFRPAGRWGNRTAIAGTAMMVIGVGSYALRKRWRPLREVGRLRHWLSFHIFLCTLGPFLIVVHTSFKVGGLVSIAFWSMVTVVASGIVGRYVYVRIPKTLNGQFRTMQEIEAEQRTLAAEIAGESGRDEAALLGLIGTNGTVEPRSPLHTLATAARLDVTGRRQQRALRDELRDLDEARRRRVMELARQHRRLAGQRLLLQPFQRLFRYWHTFHLPFAVVLLVIVFIHVGVAIAFGYAWAP